MNFLGKLKLRWKLTLSFAVVIAFFAVASTWALVLATSMIEEGSTSVAAQSLKEKTSTVSRDICLIQLASSNREASEYINDIRSAIQYCRNTTKVLFDHFSRDDEAKQLLANLNKAESKYFAGVEKAIPVTKSEISTEAISQFSEDNQLATIQSLAASITQYSQNKAARQLAFTVEIIICAFLGALLVSFLAVNRLQKIITEPLAEFRKYAAKLMRGDLSTDLPVSNADDEVAAFGRDFQALGASWRKIVESARLVADGDLTAMLSPRSEQDIFLDVFNRMIENIAVVTVQFRESVSIMSSAASEIMASVKDSAQSASDTATAATETSTIVEEVRQTSHVSSEKAKLVSEAAQTTAKISAIGRKATEEIIEGMSRIREQVDLISEAMVALGEKSQSISSIIATVDDLAKQSNLLAVNASIEAAKAGELGKGFGIVAQEVKNMAEQSKQSTAKVRTLIAEIQQATNAAAVATELGGKAVDSALTQSQQAGESIAALAGSVVQSAQAASQIAVSAQQQLTGVDQVALAMESINKACDEHLAAIKRVETATNRLNEIGKNLKELISVFDATQGSLPTASAFKSLPPV